MRSSYQVLIYDDSARHPVLKSASVSKRLKDEKVARD